MRRYFCGLDLHSNNKKKGAANRKNGNKYLGWAFLEGAHKLKRFCPAVRFWQ